MTYRRHHDHCHDAKANASASPSIVYMTRGSVVEADIECWYWPGEPCAYGQPQLHDHLGWPNPSHPDDTHKFPEELYDGMIPIDFADEGYDTFYVEIGTPAWNRPQRKDEQPPQMEFDKKKVKIKDDEPNVLVLTVGNDGTPDTVREPVIAEYTVFAQRGEVIDAVVSGHLVVMP